MDPIDSHAFRRESSMSIPHAKSGEVISVRPLGKQFTEAESCTLVRANHLEIFRLNLSEGKGTRSHEAAGTITIQCIEGRVELDAHDKTQILEAGDLVFLEDEEPHAVRALKDTSLLITILLHRQ
jgi:quercetin dioxygenase-like cupin family protein